VLDAVAAGGSARGAAARFGVGAATAVRWVRRWRETGERTARRQGHPGYSKLDTHEAFLLELVAAEVDITLEELRQRLAAERGVGAGIGTLWRFFDRRGITVKKRLATRASRRVRMSARHGWPGSRTSPISTPSASSSSTRPV
jgi:transposase